MTDRRHQVAGLQVAVDDAVRLAKQAAVDGMDERVAPSELWMLEEGRREHRFAAGRERDVHGVVHAPRNHRLHDLIAGPPSKDMRGTRDQRRLSGPLVRLLGERALGPVDPAVGPEVRPMQVVGAPREGLAREPLLAQVRDAVVIGIGEFPDAGRSSDVKRSVEPHRALRQHHAVGEDHAGIERAVAVFVFEADDAVGAIGELLLHLVVRARGVGDVQPPPLVEVRDDGAIDQRRASDADDLEAGRHGEPRLGGRSALRRGPCDATQRCRENGNCPRRTTEPRGHWRARAATRRRRSSALDTKRRDRAIRSRTWAAQGFSTCSRPSLPVTFTDAPVTFAARSTEPIPSAVGESQAGASGRRIDLDARAIGIAEPQQHRFLIRRGVSG